MSVTAFDKRSTEILSARTVKLRRTALRLRQQEVIDQVNSLGFNWHQTTLSKVEAGDRALLFTEAWALCRVLGIGLESLTDCDGWQE